MDAIFAEYADELQNFSYAIGAIDGKHFAIRCPRQGGSVYYNYKGYHSMILLALVDANYRILLADVVASGASSDASDFNDSELCEGLSKSTLGIPTTEVLTGGLGTTDPHYRLS